MNSLYMLGMMHYTGQGVDKNYAVALQHLQKAADQGHPDSQYFTGLIYFRGYGVETDYNKALPYFRMAASKSHTQALYSLGRIYLTGQGVKINYNQALHFFQNAAKTSHVPSQLQLGLMHYKGLGIIKNYNQAREFFEKAAEQKSFEALFQLGKMHYEGHGTETDLHKAEELFNKSNEISSNPETDHFLHLIKIKNKNIDIYNEELIDFLKENSEKKSMYSSFLLGKIYYQGTSAEKNINLAFDYFKKAESKGFKDALYYLGRMYFLNEIEYENEEGLEFFEKAMCDTIAPPKEYLDKIDLSENEKEYHVLLKEIKKNINLYYSNPLIKIAEAYYEGETLKKDIQKALLFFNIAAKKKLASAFYFLSRMHYKGEGVEKNLNLAKELFDEFIKHRSPNTYPDYFFDYYIMFDGLEGVEEFFNNKRKKISDKEIYEFIKEIIPDYPKNNKQIQKLLVNLAEEKNYAPAQHFLGRAYFAGKIFDKDDEKAKKYMNLAIHSKPDEELYFTEYYIMFGESNNPEKKSFWEEFITFDLEIVEEFLGDLQDHYGERNPRLQELTLALIKQENLSEGGPLSILKDLIQKTKENFTHNTSKMEFSWLQPKEELTPKEKLTYEFNPQIFSYMPASQESLATLEDVDQLLGGSIPSEIKNLREDLKFTSYFTAPFSEEGIMLQAIIQKYKNMGEKGKEKILTFLKDLLNCQQGNNRAIWTYYTTESLPLHFAELQNVTNWLVRLSDTDRPYLSDEILFETFKKNRDNLYQLIYNVIQKGHIFRNHLTELKTKEAEKLKALLGSIVNDEKSIPTEDRKQLGKTLLKALQIIVDLSNRDTFFEKLDSLCDAYEIYPPANKFGDQLTPQSLELLIQKLKAQDVDGRGDLKTYQTELRNFVASDIFINKLNDFQTDEGAKLRALVNGFIQNGWPVGLLNLMETSNTDDIDIGIRTLHEKVRIDKDITLTWDNFKNLILRELPDLKQRAINHIVENIEKGQEPHSVDYVQKLLGGIIGLRANSEAITLDPHQTVPEEGEKSVLNLSLQEGLDLFHETFTPQTLIEHLSAIIKENKLSIIDPKTGNNVIWLMTSIAGKEVLSKKYPKKSQEDIEDLLTNEEENNIAQLALALLLEQLGIFQIADGGDD
jgi:TPR repeat protein